MLMLTATLVFSMGVPLTIFSSNPSLLIVWLVMLSVVVGLILSLKSSSWMLFAVVLLFTGGMMVLFSYMLTLVSSTKITFFGPSSLSVVVWGLLLILMVSGDNSFYQFQAVGGLYNFSQILILFFLVLNLLVTLVVVVKLALTFKGALKAYSNNEI